MPGGLLPWIKQRSGEQILKGKMAALHVLRRDRRRRRQVGLCHQRNSLRERGAYNKEI